MFWRVEELLLVWLARLPVDDEGATASFLHLPQEPE